MFMCTFCVFICVFSNSWWSLPPLKSNFYTAKIVLKHSFTSISILTTWGLRLFKAHTVLNRVHHNKCRKKVRVTMISSKQCIWLVLTIWVRIFLLTIINSKSVKYICIMKGLIFTHTELHIDWHGEECHMLVLTL